MLISTLTVLTPSREPPGTPFRRTGAITSRVATGAGGAGAVSDEGGVGAVVEDDREGPEV